jgi:hypothetical protein
MHLNDLERGLVWGWDTSASLRCIFCYAVEFASMFSDFLHNNNVVWNRRSSKCSLKNCVYVTIALRRARIFWCKRIELVQYLIFLSDKLHVLPLQVMFLVCEYNVETRLLLSFICLVRELSLYAKSRDGSCTWFMLKSLLACGWTDL